MPASRHTGTGRGIERHSAAANADTITDLVSGTDRIGLSASAFAGLTPGVLSAAQLHAGTAALAADDRLIYDAASGRLWFDADGSGAGAQSLVATLAAGTALAATDIVVL